MPSNPYVVGTKSAGDEISSTYEGRHLTFLESELTHPDNTAEEALDYVNKGDPVIVGDVIVGVALNDGKSVNDLIAIDTEGIWVLDATAEDIMGGSIVLGDDLFLDNNVAVNKVAGTRFGYALSPLAYPTTGNISVKVHFTPCA